MDNRKDDAWYLEKVKHHFERINVCMSEVSYEAFVESEDLQEISMFNLIQISEQVTKLSDEYKEKNKEIPWKEIYGLRNRIVHDYGGVVLDVVYKTLKNDIPELYRKMFAENEKK